MSEATSIAEVVPVAGEETTKTPDVSRETTQEVEVKQELNEDGTPKEPEKQAEKPEKTEAERERIRMQRGIDRKTRQAAEARAQAEALRRENDELRRRLTPDEKGVDYQSESGDSEKLTLTKAEVARFIEDEARKMAPTIAKQTATEEQLRSAAVALKQELGDEFDELTEELEDVLPREKQLALLSAKNAAPLVRYLADPDNAAEAKSLAAMSDFQAGMTIHALELKLAQKASAEKPKPSNAPAPIEPVKGQGTITSSPDPVKNPKAWRQWANEQERRVTR